MTTELAGRLVEVRKRLGLTQRELAERLGVSFRGLQDNESGKSVPGGQALAGYARLGIDLTWLLLGPAGPGGEEESRRSPVSLTKVPLAHFLPHEIEGPYILPFEERQTRSLLQVDVEWLQRLTGRRRLGQQDRVSLCTFEMSDMEMLLSVPANALVIFDAEQTEIRRGGLFVIRHGGQLSVRRLQVKHDGSIALVPDISRVLEEAVERSVAERIVVGLVVAVVSAVVA